MEKLHHPLGRGISYLLIYLTAIQPLHPAFAAGINSANTTTQVQAGNVPVINIATPNSAGISHNTYKDFNVGAPGAVLNNSTVAGKSQLAGQVNANTNLTGNAANLIINEVTGGTRSELNGKLEVFGAKANVMIANPNGITCDGCGFINTPGVTLTTGKPQFDKQGALDALEVKKGSIIIGSKGLDASAQDYVDIISRATELNGKITAQNLSLTQGPNRAGYKDGTLTAIAGEGAQPQLAVDTKALGGMYANKIRLVANEEGVGVNLANLTSTQQGITLDTKGKIQLGNTAAKTDLNITSKQTDIIKGATVQSERDITVASTTLNNAGTLSAGKDMRLFNDNLTNTQATIQANNNLWIQKDAVGNKGVKVENRSGTIKTTRGDLVIRTEQLENVRDTSGVAKNNILPTQSAKKGVDKSPFLVPNLTLENQMYFGFFSNFRDGYPEKWFGEIDINSMYSSVDKLLSINVTRDDYYLSFVGAEPKVTSFKNLYLNSSILNNLSGSISAQKDLFLTGQRLNSEGVHISELNGFNVYQIIGTEVVQGNCTVCTINTVRLVDKKKSWEAKSIYPAQLSAGGNLVADFSDSINIGTKKYTDEKADEVKISNPSVNLKAKNILLHAREISNESNFNASENITFIADESAKLKNSQVTAGNVLSIISGDSIDAKQSSLAGNTVSLQSRTGDINVYSDAAVNYFNENGTRQLSQINASDDLSIHAARNLGLTGVLYLKNKNTTLTAGNNLLVKSDDAFLRLERLGSSNTDAERQTFFNDTLKQLNSIDTTGDITLNAGKILDISGAALNASNTISLTAGEDINLNSRSLATIPESIFPESRQAELSSRLSAGNQLLISSGRDLLAQSADLSARGNTTLLAGNNLILFATGYSAIDSANDNNKDDRYITARVHAGKKLTLAANGDFIANGTDFSSGNDMTLSSGGKMELNAVSNHIYREEGNAYSETVTQKNATLNSGGVLTLLSNGSILFQATQLIAKGALDAAAKGGFLYAQAMEESSHYEKTTTKRKWYGKKTTIRQVSHNLTNKVTEFTAGGDINLLSRDDSTYEASKINAGKNAKLTSTNGKVNFKAVKNTAFEQTITTSKGFFIKNADKGYTKDTWVLPTVYTGGKLTVDAANGVSADVKVQNAQALQNVLLTLGNTPGTAWLKDLNTRKDVQWTQVQDAYSSWNHKSQSLNPVVGAVIAIAVAAVTAGAGLAAHVADLAAGTLGSTSAAVTAATYGAAYSGITAITSQAAVALLDNQGNISKTLEALSNSNSVKSLVTAMVIGGALSGFDSVMGFDKAAGGAAGTNAGNAKLPLLSKGDWSKIAQRVAGQSIISSSLNTTINGGSFKDNFTTALLANIGNQFQAEGAFLIGENGAVLEAPGKMLSHAVVAGVAAEISGGNVKGAAAGALAAELAGIIINDNLVKTEGWQEKQAQISRFTGALIGAVATGNVSGVNSGANAAEIVERFNRQLHLDEIEAIKALAQGDKEKEMRLLAASCRKVNCVAQESLNSEERQQYEMLMRLYPVTREEEGMLANYWVQKERQRTSNYPLYLGYDTEQLFTYTTADGISDSQLFARNQWIENFSEMTHWSKDAVEALGFGISIASTFAGMGKAGIGNQYLSKNLVTPTMGWKSYLVNEETIQQASAFKQQVTSLRAGLPSAPKRSGNVAVADINIPGIPKSLAAHSGVDVSGNGLVGKGSESFKYQEIPNSQGSIIARNIDSEYKILDNISDKLGGNISVKGTVTIFTERPACGSCLGVVEQFQQRYPGIEVKILDNNGVILKPGARK